MAERSATIRKDLTNYALGISQELQKAQILAKVLAPVVPVGASSGLFNKFDLTNDFQSLANEARRPVGGQATVLGFLGSTANFNCAPHGLRINIDSHEAFQVANNPEALNALELAKTRSLTINSFNAHLLRAITVIKANVTAQAGVGLWADPAVDPIQELDDQILGGFEQTGIVFNNCVVDFGAWLLLKNHPKVRARFPGADIVSVTPEKVQAFIGAGTTKITVAETAVLTNGGLGNTAAKRQSVLKTSVLLFYNSDMPTQYDASFCKSFAPTAEIFTGIKTYEEQPNITWFENDWTADIQIVSSLLCRRIDVSNVYKQS